MINSICERLYLFAIQSCYQEERVPGQLKNQGLLNNRSLNDPKRCKKEKGEHLSLQWIMDRASRNSRKGKMFWTYKTPTRSSNWHRIPSRRKHVKLVCQSIRIPFLLETFAETGWTRCGTAHLKPTYGWGCVCGLVSYIMWVRVY